MRSIKLLGLGVVSALALAAFVGVSSAAAQTWNPQNTPKAATLSSPGSGSLVLRDNVGNTVTCKSIAGTYVESPIGGKASVAGTVNSSGSSQPPQFSSCSSNLGSATASGSDQWLFTATSTSNVNVTNAGAVAKITTILGVCTVTVPTNTAVSNNAWSNSNSTLTVNSGATFSISESGFGCDGAKSASESGTISVPGVTIV